MSANADQITYWNEVAGATWVAHQAQLDRLFGPLTDALLTGAAVAQGDRVVDIGCGCGDLSLRSAARAGPRGRVTAVDVSRPMLVHGEARAAALASGDRAPIEWVVADAMTHVFAPTADLLVSRFGVMFFDDRPRAFANLRGALTPGGRFAFLTWRPRSEVEWMQAPLEWIAAAIAMPDETTGEIGPFGLADPGMARQLFEAAGFRDVTVEPVDHALSIAPTVDDALRLLTAAGPASRAIRDSAPEQQEEAMRLLRDKLVSLQSERGIVLGGACWLYKGVA